MTAILRVYTRPEDLGKDGYPRAWHKCVVCLGDGCPECAGAGSAKDLVRALAGHRCVRCLHPYVKGQHVGLVHREVVDGEDAPLRLADRVDVEVERDGRPLAHAVLPPDLVAAPAVLAPLIARRPLAAPRETPQALPSNLTRENGGHE